MSHFRLTLILAAVLGGCGDDGFGVAVSILADATLSDGQVASIRKLEVDSDEGFKGSSFDLGRSFSPTRLESFIYRPKTTATSVTLTVSAFAADGTVVSTGKSTAVLQAGKTVALTVTLLGQGAPGDMSAPVDAAPDFATPADMASADLSPVLIAPSHVSASTFVPNASDLSGVTGINTTTLKISINNGAFDVPPAGVTFTADSGFAVLSCGQFTVDRDIAVTGNKGLVVVASKGVDVMARIVGAANMAVPGPGGGGPGLGMGGGGLGASSSDKQAGGGGGGYGTKGAAGGNTDDGALGGIAGNKYLGALTDFAGGSGGGNAPSGASGAAGGGAIQISTGGMLVIHAGGGINVNGAGGTGATAEMGSFYLGGGGGGSGGEVFLEGISVLVDGTLTANGGGGGSGDGNTGGVGTVGGTPGPPGQDGQFSTMVAKGGAVSNGAQGGDGAAAATAATPGAMGLNSSFALSGGGGGGGGVGVIWIRSRGAAPNVANATISPAPKFDGTL